MFIDDYDAAIVYRYYHCYLCGRSYSMDYGIPIENIRDGRTPTARARKAVADMLRDSENAKTIVKQRNRNLTSSYSEPSSLSTAHNWHLQYRTSMFAATLETFVGSVERKSTVRSYVFNASNVAGMSGEKSQACTSLSFTPPSWLSGSRLTVSYITSRVLYTTQRPIISNITFGLRPVYRVPISSPIVEACRRTDLSSVRTLVETSQASPFDIDVDDNGLLVHILGNSPARPAAAFDIVQYLVDSGLDPTKSLDALHDVFSGWQQECLVHDAFLHSQTDRHVYVKGEDEPVDLSNIMPESAMEAYYMENINIVAKLALRRALEDAFCSDVTLDMLWSFAGIDGNWTSSFPTLQQDSLREHWTMIEEMAFRIPDTVFGQQLSLKAHPRALFRRRLDAKYALIEALCTSGARRRIFRKWGSSGQRDPLLGESSLTCNEAPTHMLFTVLSGTPSQFRGERKQQGQWGHERIQIVRLLACLMRDGEDPRVHCSCSRSWNSRNIVRRSATCYAAELGCLDLWQKALQQAGYGSSTSMEDTVYFGLCDQDQVGMAEGTGIEACQVCNGALCLPYDAPKSNEEQLESGTEAQGSAVLRNVFEGIVSLPSYII